MKKHITMAAGLVSSALFIGLISATPASATDATASCTTTGATGHATVYNFDGATDKITLNLGVYDSLADGHHVRVRLLTKNYVGTTKYWSWHANYDGAGVGKSWDTTATDSNGIFDVGVQVARFEGDSLLNSCTDWA